MSVSTFWMSSGAAMPLRVVNAGMPPAPEPAAAAEGAAPAAAAITCRVAP